MIVGSERKVSLTVLVHICCAPDAAHGMDALSSAVGPCTGFFYNPNIDTPEERDRRIEATRDLQAARPFPLLIGKGGEAEWETATEGLDGEPEKGKRCEACIRFRLRETARKAKSTDMASFATVLTVSRKKDAAMINRIGREISALEGIPFVESDLKKNDGENRVVAISKELGIYRQDYCGCRPSRRNRDERLRKVGGSVRESNPPETFPPPDRI